MKTNRLFVASLFLLATTALQAECIKNRAALLPITLWQNKLYVPVTLNGVSRPFFVDTGAAVTTISQSLAGELDLPHDFDHTMDTFGVGGQESHLYIGEVTSLSLGGIAVKNHNFPVADFGERLADGSSRPGGLIGADILSRFDLDIDIPHRQLALWRVTGCTEMMPDWEGKSAAVPMQVATSRHVTIPVRIDGANLDLLLDTGAPDLLLSTHAAARAGATPEVLEENRQLEGSGVNDRAFHAWLHIFQRVEIGDQVYGDVRTIVVENGRYGSMGDGLLGVEFLKRGRVWLSYSTGNFFAQSNRN
jgi:clan AA aspartic protease (TIGR02281 family)